MAADPHRTYEIRCPVHGFISFNDWERDIISQPAFPWTQFPGSTIVSDTGELTLGDVFAIERGLATGANTFFILTEAEAKNLHIPRPS